MLESNLNRCIQIVLDKLHCVMQEAEHLTPTLNDIYDTFNALNLRIERTEKNSQEITKALKQLTSATINKKEMALTILKLYLMHKRI